MRSGGLLPIIVASMGVWGFYRLIAVAQWGRAAAAVVAIAASAGGFWLAVFHAPPTGNALAECFPLAMTVCIVVLFPLAVVGVISGAEDHLPTRSRTLGWLPRNATEGRARRIGALLGLLALAAYGASTSLLVQPAAGWGRLGAFILGASSVYKGLLQGFLGASSGDEPRAV